jgi:hypothetical protein
MASNHSMKLGDSAPIESLMAAAYAADPRDRLIAPVGDGAYSTLFGLIPEALAVLRVAAEIESDPDELLNWYSRSLISELGHLSAKQLVSLGRAVDVINFLRNAQDGVRD